MSSLPIILFVILLIAIGLCEELLEEQHEVVKVLRNVATEDLVSGECRRQVNFFIDNLVNGTEDNLWALKSNY